MMSTLALMCQVGPSCKWRQRGECRGKGIAELAVTLVLEVSTLGGWGGERDSSLPPVKAGTVVGGGHCVGEEAVCEGERVKDSGGESERERRGERNSD